MILKSTLIGATAIAIALTSFDLGPAKAGEGGTQVNSYKQSDEISAARKRRGYRTNPAVPLAAFGAIIGTIGAVAAANSRRDYYSRWGGSGGQPGYHGPNVNVPGATNYGNAAGQNGQQPPSVPQSSNGGAI